MMIFTSVYGVVDGLFVSNFAGKTAFAAVNLIMPFLMILAAIGFMAGTGGSAVVAKALGEGKRNEANRYFSMIVLFAALAGAALGILGIIFMRSAAHLAGAEEQTAELCVLYGRIVIAALPAFMLQNVFQSFFVTAEKPKLGLWMTVAAGTANMVLDLLFVGIFKWGVAGAAAATAISQLIGGCAPVVYFLSKNTSLLRLVKPVFNARVLIKTCTNGSSELMTNLSMSLVNMLYNYQLIKAVGESGVAAYGVIMYVNFIFTAIYIGYSIGSAPIAGYNYGAENTAELRSLFKKSMIIIGTAGVVLTASAIALAPSLSAVFVGYDRELYEMTVRGFIMYSLAFVPMGFNIFGSAFFTALSNGFVSALISFLRTLVFQLVSVLVLPLVLGLDGIWLSVAAAEGAALCVTVYLFAAMRKKYYYV